MFKLSIILNFVSAISSSYLEAESNFLKPKLERNNILNKGLWVRARTQKPGTSSFIFRPNSLDADNMLQSNYDTFSENFIQNGPLISSYVERNKRSTYNKQKEGSTKKCKDGAKCPKVDTPKFTQPDVIINKLKASVFNNYPYGLADIFENQNKYDTSNEINQQLDLGTIISGNDVKEIPINKLTNANDVPTNSQTNSSNIKRSMDSQKNDFETRLIKKIEFIEPINKTDNNEIKIDRSVFDKEKDVVWHQTAPVDVNVYKVLPKTEESSRFKPISERGLIKVLSMLTKTFKKIMKQHNDIKTVHKQLHTMNEDFMKNVNNLNKQFADFDSKYAEILKVNTELKKMEEKLKTREQYFNDKEKEFSKNLIDFENQQRKFLAQQKQFYMVQKLMLEQNEKINLKQNVISKTQSEISHRQNNFARILKKAKQLYTNMKDTQATTLNVGISKPKNDKPKEDKIPMTTTVIPTTTPVKINLLSIPEAPTIQNYDKLILDEKDYQTIDDLIYKYYFNNTFIDEIMRNKILASLGSSEKRNVIIKKNKRNQTVGKETTKLFPVNDTNNNKFNRNNIKRERRWIKHPRKLIKKTVTKPVTTTTAKSIFKAVEKQDKVKQVDIFKPNPFIVMATSFCNEIGQNGNAQILSWCIEKALRRLQIMDMHLSKILPPPGGKINVENIPIVDNSKSTTVAKTQETQTTATPAVKSTVSDMTTNIISENSNILMYFPDNEELESNLKQFELIPDTEGTVYFDGSLHSSDIDKLAKYNSTYRNRDSDGFSDIMPGLDSNSRVEVDPLAFDIQAQRRANVQRINERIMKLKMV